MMGMEQVRALLARWLEQLGHWITDWFLEPVGMSVDATPYLALFALFCILRLENQRWVVSRARTFFNEPGPVGALVDLTGGVSLVFAVAFLAAIGFDQGIKALVVTALLGVFVTACWAFVFSNRGVRGAGWVAGTAMIWPIMYALLDDVTWFGRFHI